MELMFRCKGFWVIELVDETDEDDIHPLWSPVLVFNSFNTSLVRS